MTAFCINEAAAIPVERYMRLWEELFQDGRSAVRSARRAPGFTAAVLFPLALGIGANTAIFSVLYTVWLAPAKYVDAERLVSLSREQLTGQRFLSGASYPELTDWKAQATTVAELGVHRFTREVDVATETGAEEVIGHRVSANLFELLGVRPILGQALDASADQSAGPRQALLSYTWWMRRFGGDTTVIGRTVRIDDEAVTITGVMPEGFSFPPLGSSSFRPVLWMSLNATADQRQNRASRPVSVIARLRAGVSLDQAQAEMDTIAARLAKAFPERDGEWGIRVLRLNEARQLDDVRPTLLLVMGAAGMVLLIACANIANLLLARAFHRDREMALRRALGATGARLARQVLTESGLLALAGGVAGALLAYLAMPALRAVLPADMPRADELTVNGPVLGFAIALSLLSGFLFGLLPAVQWGSHARTQPSAQSRSTRMLVTAEMAVAVVLLTATGLMVESFRRVSQVDLGFQTEDVFTMRLQLARSRYPTGIQVANLRTELLRRLAALPGVMHAGTVSSLPMGALMQGAEFEIEGRPETARAKPFLDFASVSGDYFTAMGIPLVRGRYLDAGSQPAVLISESAARTYWPDGDAVGSLIRLDGSWLPIAGIVKDVQQYSPERGARGGTIYALNEHLPLIAQGTDLGRWFVVVVRTAGTGSASIGTAMRQTLAGLDREQSTAEVTAMEELVRRTLAGRRLQTLLLGLFAGLAILLAVMGIFGVAAYAVARRTKELGIRTALGATPSSLLRLVAKETVWPASVGAAVGVGSSKAGSQVLASFLFGVSPTEPLILAGAALVMLAVALAAGLPPWWRAMQMGPMAALREE